jgi:hypothetical protein
MTNGSDVAETHTFEVADPTSTWLWVLSGDATTTDPLTGSPIEVTIPAYGTGTVSRETPPMAPTITGPTAETVTVGYLSFDVGPYAVTGNPAPVVALTGDTSGGKITWNAETQSLDVAAGLPVGTYTVTLTASNGVSPDASLTFKLTVKAKTDPGDKDDNKKPIPPTGDMVSFAPIVVATLSSFVTLGTVVLRKRFTR